MSLERLKEVNAGEAAIRMEGWPQVELEFVKQASDAEVQQWLNDMDSLLDKKHPFVMLIHARPNSHFSPEARKAMGLWFKATRNELGVHCVGVARLVESEEHGARVVSERMKATMPFPMMSTTCEKEAGKWLGKRLNT